MLVESSSNVELILRFFDMFLKLKDLTSSEAFKEYDPDRRGLISKKDFQRAMEGCQHYSPSDTEFLLSCVETDENELLDYQAFVKRFHEPAKDIGFNVAVLLTNLSEHMPGDARLHTFLELAESVLRYLKLLEQPDYIQITLVTITDLLKSRPLSLKLSSLIQM